MPDTRRKAHQNRRADSSLYRAGRRYVRSDRSGGRMPPRKRLAALGVALASLLWRSAASQRRRRRRDVRLRTDSPWRLDIPTAAIPKYRWRDSKRGRDSAVTGFSLLKAQIANRSRPLGNRSAPAPPFPTLPRRRHRTPPLQVLRMRMQGMTGDVFASSSPNWLLLGANPFVNQPTQRTGCPGRVGPTDGYASCQPGWSGLSEVGHHSWPPGVFGTSLTALESVVMD